MARDAWDKAQIVSGLLSSVVIALVGIGVSCSVQRAQIASAEAAGRAQAAAEAARARNEQALQQSRLTADLLSYLSSAEPVKRQLAIKALASAVPVSTYEDVLTVIAQADTSGAVRRAALSQLAASSRPAVLDALVRVGADSVRPAAEREQARASAQLVALRSGLGRDTYVFGAGREAMESSDVRHGTFTFALLSALEGEADLDSDGSVTASELASFLAYRVPQLSGEPPVTVYSGPPATAVDGRGYERIVGVFVGVSQYRIGEMFSLRYPADDARAMHALYSREARGRSADLQLLVDSAAVRATVVGDIQQAAERADSTTLLVLYFAGRSRTDAWGEPSWTLHDAAADGSGSLPLADIKALLRRSRARAKVLLIDAKFALPDAGR